MMEFSLSSEEIIDILVPEFEQRITGPGVICNSRYKRFVQNFKKQVRNGYKPDSVHFMIYALLTGSNVFLHFLPKQEAGFLRAVLAEDPTYMGPYRALFQCTALYISFVGIHPFFSKDRPIQPYKVLAEAYHIGQCILPFFEPFGLSERETFRIAYELRPHVLQLHKEIYKFHGKNQIGHL